MQLKRVRHVFINGLVFRTFCSRIAAAKVMLRRIAASSGREDAPCVEMQQGEVMAKVASRGSRRLCGGALS
jgi:hypothetical protein